MIKKAAVLTIILSHIALLIIGVMILKIKAEDKQVNARLVLPIGFSQILVESPKKKNRAATIDELKEELVAASKASKASFMVVNVNLSPKLKPDGAFAKDRSHIFYYPYQSSDDPFQVIGELSTRQLDKGVVYSNDPEVKSQRRLSPNGEAYYFTVDNFKYHQPKGTGYVFVDSRNKAAYRTFIQTLKRGFQQTYGAKLRLIDQQTGANMLVSTGATNLMNVYFLVGFILAVQIVGLVLWGVYLTRTVTTFISWGFTAPRIVFAELSRPIGISTVLATAVCLAWQRTIWVIWLALLLALILGLLAIGVTYGVMHWSFSERQLNRHRRQVILAALLTVKILVMVFAASVVSPLTSATTDRWVKDHTTSNGAPDSPFAVVYPLYVSRDQININLNQSTTHLDVLYDRVLYRQFESMGGVLFYAYMQDDHVEHAEFVIINQNYLRFNPLQDTSGKTVFVGNPKQNIALVPYTNQKKLQHAVTELKQFYKKEKFSVILLKPKQTLQTFGPDNIRIPLPKGILIKSQANSQPGKRPFLSTFDLSVSFKLPITKATSAKVYASLLPTLRRHGIEDNIQTLIPENQLSKVELQQIFEEQWAYHGQIIAIMVLSITLCVLYAVVDIFLNGRRYALMYTMGSSFWRAHRLAIGLFGIEISALFVLQVGVFRYSSLLVLLAMITVDGFLQLGINLYGRRKYSGALFEE